MTLIKVKGIKNVEKQQQASIRGGCCIAVHGGTEYRCQAYNINIEANSIESVDTLTKNI